MYIRNLYKHPMHVHIHDQNEKTENRDDLYTQYVVNIIKSNYISNCMRIRKTKHHTQNMQHLQCELMQPKKKKKKNTTKKTYKQTNKKQTNKQNREIAGAP